MMFFYTILTHIAYFLLKIIAVFNKKIKLFVTGRTETWQKISSIEKENLIVWIHAASLGEFEQARPIIEHLKKEHPNYKIVVTFFSPSGYEIRKHYDLADVVCYLPFDTRQNMKRFIQQLHPDLAIIIKYEFWPNLLKELQQNKTKTILVSGIFRKNQAFFKPYGAWMKKFLGAFDHFFVQNNTSKDLLHSINFTNVTISGDTRFDRVSKILHQNNSLPFIAAFKNNNYTVVAGSTWPEDEILLVDYINNSASSKEKFIIAPHNIKTKAILELKNSITKNVLLFSEKDNKVLTNYDVFIIDTIGILTKIYNYADVAYVGGGLATGLHNVLEPATFGIPLVFGNKKHQKFQEAMDLIQLRGAISIGNQQEFTSTFTKLYNHADFREKKGSINQSYVAQRTGATALIMDYIKPQLK